ncbi:peptidase [Roseateles sp. DAIF2]|uniref:nuclear transport factor 2 family protein n=1 Tax=Roseateles sp. DAIF2 TaxID=2714952 RepID=UPI0018A32937|nr:nuclear transport factor 2 family protein [Roseateles sp. DAIF2]QPF75148.1 peptidase [Roseateles sp. DAIF2]
MDQYSFLGGLRKIIRMGLLLCLPLQVFHLSAAAQSLPAQSEKTDTEQISETLEDYMQGVANGDAIRLRKAFHPDFKLYAVNRDKTLLVRSGEQYIKDATAYGKFNRVGRILSVDVEDEVAMAKVEILTPGDRLFIDFFQLLKYEGAWKIVNKSYTWKAAPKRNKKILFITSNQHTYGNTKLDTSNHFDEIVVAYDVFKKQGYTVDFVSPQGGAIPIGYIKTSDGLHKQYLYNAEFMNLLKHTLKPAQIKVGDYQAVYYSGGGAAMFGVAENAEIQAIATGVHRNGGIVSAVCHGTAGLVHLKNSAGVPLYSGKKITGYPDAFENKTAAYYKTFPFSIDAEITRNGGNLVHAKEFGTNFYVVDGQFITGQDPSSTASVASKVIEALQGK